MRFHARLLAAIFFCGAATAAVAEPPDSLVGGSTTLDSLEAKLSRNRLTRELSRYVFQPSALPLQEQAAVTPSLDFFAPYAGLTIRHIVIERLDVFSAYDAGGGDAVQSTLSRVGDALHFNTRRGIIENYLLMHEGERLDPNALADSERLLRAAPFLQEANVVVAPVESAPDSVDLYVVTRDRWTLGLDLKIKNTSSADIRLADRNFAGWGHHFENLLLIDAEQPQELGYVGRYRVDNISGSFVRNAYEYRNTYRERAWGVVLSRAREAPQIRSTGALAFAMTDLKPAPGDVPRQAFLETFVWGGRAFPVGKAPHGGVSRQALVPALGYDYLDFYVRPDSVTADFNRPFRDRHLVLASFSFTKSDFEQGRLLRGYGWREDIPHGLLATLTGGMEFSEFENRAYGAAELRAAKYTGWGYLAFRAAGGTFLHQRTMEDGVVDLAGSYFTPLLDHGGYGFRQFFQVSYTHGFRRRENDDIPLDGSAGFAGITGSPLRDRQRLVGGLESVLLTPWKAFGFRFGFFGRLDIGTIGPEADSFLEDKYYSIVGFGIRLHNELLVFEPTELRYSHALASPEGASTKVFDFGPLPTTPFLGLDPGPPSTIPYR